jgi:hypothetical protein
MTGTEASCTVPSIKMLPAFYSMTCPLEEIFEADYVSSQNFSALFV